MADAGKAYCQIARELSESKARVAELQECLQSAADVPRRVPSPAEERLRQALRAGRMVTYEWDVACDCVIRSDNAEDLFGVAGVQRGTSRVFFEMIHPDDRVEYHKALATLAERRGVHAAQYRLVRPKGSVVWVEDTGQGEFDGGGRLVRLHGVMTDITQRKLAEDGLRVANERLELAQRAARAGTWDRDLTTGRLEWTKELFELFGLDPDTAVASLDTWRSVIHPEDVQAVMERTELAIRDHVPLVMEYRIVRPGGQIRWISALGRSTYDETGRPLRTTGICIDITDHKRAEETLRESEAKFRTILDGAPIGIFESTPEGKNLYVNAEFARILGYDSPQEITEAINARSVAEVIYMDPSARPRLVEQVLRSGGWGRCENRYRRKDGSLMIANLVFRSVRDSQGRTRLLGFVEDITERKEAEEALRASEEQLRYIVKHDPNAVAVLDKEMRYIFVSDRFLRDYKVAEQDVIGRCHYDVFPEMPQRWKDIHQRVLAGGVERAEEDAFVRLDGSVDYNRWECRPWYDPDDHIGGMIMYTEVITERKRAEMALRESEEQLRLTMESAQMGTFDWYPQTGQVIWSELTKRFWGLPPDAHVDFDVFTAGLHPEDRPRVAQMIQNTRDVGHDTDFSLEYRAIGIQDGRERWVAGLGRAYFNEQGEAVRFAGTVMDITERKRAEKALEETHSRLKATLDALPDFLFVVDRSGLIKDFRAPHPELVDAPSENFVGREMGTVMPEPAASIIKGAIADAMAHRGRHQGSVCCLPMPTGPRWFELSIAAQGDLQSPEGLLVILAHDITDRKQAEESLRASEERFRSLVEASSDWVWAIDREGRYTYASPKIKDLLGYEPQEVIGRRPFDFMPPEEATRVMHLVAGALRAGEPITGIENTNLHKDGRRVVLETNGVPIFDAAGSLLGYRGIDRDITQRKRAEEQLKALNDTLEQRVAERTAEAEWRAAQLQRLASQLTQAEQRERQRLGQLLHDHLQQLLVGAKFNVGILRRRLTEREQPSLLQVDELLDESLAASRSLTAELSPPILHEGNLTQVLQWLARRAKEKHGLMVTVTADEQADPHAPEVRSLLFQAVQELLLNITKHAKTDRARVTLSQSGADMVQILVADEGAGFDLAGKQTEQTNCQSGSGFGLFSIRERLELLGGRMEIDSRPGEGTRVVLAAPCRLAGEDTVAPVGPPEEQPVAADGQAPHLARHDEKIIHILLADDHAVVRDGLSRLLETQADVEVIGQAADGLEAVEMALELRPDVILMDVSMPNMNGVEATRRIVQQLPDARVIGLSMHVQEDIAAQMIAAGATAYLTKTTAPDALITTIRECVPSSVARPRA